jgi:hypothetical protein
MRSIGTAGASVTIARRGAGYWRGLVQAKCWRGRFPVSLAVDLATSRVDATLAGQLHPGWSDDPANDQMTHGGGTAMLPPSPAPAWRGVAFVATRQGRPWYGAVAL